MLRLSLVPSPDPFVAAAAMFLAGLLVTAFAVDAGKQQHSEGASPVHMG
jgi:hypothetical protein